MAPKPVAALPAQKADAAPASLTPGLDNAEWESDLAAWDAALPVLSPPPGSEPQGGGGDRFRPFATTLPPTEGAASATTAPTGAAASKVVAVGAATIDWFDQEPPTEDMPAFPDDVLPQMSEAAWRENGARKWVDWNELPSTSTTPLVHRVQAPDSAYWEGFAELLRDERARNADVPRAFELHLASARISERLGQIDEAIEHLDAAMDLPGLSSMSGLAPAAHRARLCLAERTLRLDDVRVPESVQRLALLDHPDQPTYRALWAEWTLARVARGGVDAAAAARIAAAPSGLPRTLAEAELVWNRPATAAAILETAGHGLGGSFGAALLTLAAALTEHAGDVQTAAEQRLAAARMETRLVADTFEGRAPNLRTTWPSPLSAPRPPQRGRPVLGLIRDLGRLDSAASIEALTLLLNALPASELKVALARWGSQLASQRGDGEQAALFVFDQGHHEAAAAAAAAADADVDHQQDSRPDPDRWWLDSSLGPPSIALLRARLDTFANRGGGAHGERVADDASPEGLLQTLADAWGTTLEARVCLAWSACALAMTGAEARLGDVDAALTWLTGDLHHAGDVGGETGANENASAHSASPSSWAALAAPIQAVASRFAPLSAPRLKWLGIWERIDVARRATAWRERVEELTPPAPGAVADSPLDGPPREFASAMLAWRASARATARGQPETAAAWLRSLASAPGWERSRLKEPLIELAGVRVFGRPRRADDAGTTHPIGEGDGDASMSQGGGAVDLANRLAACADPHRLEESPTALEQPSPGNRRPVSPPQFLGELVSQLAAQPGPPAFWATVAATWAGLAGQSARARDLAVGALGDPVHGAAAARILRRLVASVGDPDSRAEILLMLARPGAPAHAWVEAAEAREKMAAGGGGLPDVARLFELALRAPDASPVAADIAFGGFRCGVQAAPWRRAPDEPLSEAERALIDLETLQKAIEANQFDEALALLVDSPPHENSPSAQTWAFAATVAAALLPSKPALTTRLWARAEDLAIRPVASSHAASSHPTGRSVAALFRLADATSATERVRRSRAQELLAEMALQGDPKDAASSALFLWLAAGAGERVASAGSVPRGGPASRGSVAARGGAGGAGPSGVAVFSPAVADDPAETERRLRKGLESAALIAAAPMVPRQLRPCPVPLAIAWRRFLAQSGRVVDAAAAAALEAETMADPENRVVALMRAADLDADLEDKRRSSRGSGGHGSGSARTNRGQPSTSTSPSPSQQSQSPSSTSGARAQRQAAREGWLREVLRLAPDHTEAFRRLRDIYEAEARHPEWMDLLQARLAATKNPFETTALRLARADGFAGPLGDIDSAKRELHLILEREPQHARALGRLAEWEEATGNVAAAADLLVRRAATERDPEKRCDAFLRLGRIHIDRLPDAKRAAAAYGRALQLDPENREALDALAHLYFDLGDTRAALAVTHKLVNLEPDLPTRSGYLAHVGKILERAHDGRGAQAAFREAVDLCPTNLVALGDLLRVIELGHDVVGRQFVLDGVANRLRSTLLARPSEAAVCEAMSTVMALRGRSAAAAALTEWSAWIWSRQEGSGADSDAVELAAGMGPGPGVDVNPVPSAINETATANTGATTMKPRRLIKLASTTNQDLIFSPAVPPAFRRLCLRLGPLSWEDGKLNLAALGVTRAMRVPNGSPARLAWERIAADLGAGAFELYLTPSLNAALDVLPGKPPALVVASDIVHADDADADSGASSAATHFAAGRTLFLVATGLHFALTGARKDLANWLTAVVRQYVPDYLHADASDDEAQLRATQLLRTIPKKTRQELAPFALECSGDLDLEALRAGVLDAANRAGFIAAGSLTAAVRGLLIHASALPIPWSVRPGSQAMNLFEFAMSDDYDALLSTLSP